MTDGPSERSTPRTGGAEEAPPISDYSLIGDCHGAALVSSSGSIDWCCMPRFDSGSCFGRLLDWERAGCCAILLDGAAPPRGSSRYVEDSLVVETTLAGERATVQVLDFLPMRDGGADDPLLEVVRIVRCTRGAAPVQITVAPRFDYGEVRPWLRRAGVDTFTAIGGDDGMLVWSDGEIVNERDSLAVRARLGVGEQLRLVLRFVRPHELEGQTSHAVALDAGAVDQRLEQTLAWWRRWCERLRGDGPRHPAVVRSALTLKALTYAPTGAIAAAATASLPEAPGAGRNWDYRFSWIRDSTLAAHALAELGCEREAGRFRHFIVRSSAGHADDLQVLFGVGGERRTVEQEIALAGYRNSQPVRVGNQASNQLQLDAFGEILDLAWRWHLRGHSPDDDEWRFFYELVETAAARWQEPDCGIWEWRGEPRHFVHSKACCWTALDRGLRLADDCARRAPERRWRAARDEIRAAIESRGYDADRGVFVQCLDERALDAALLLLPTMGFVAFDDERMVRTTDAVREELGEGDFIMRYRGDDGLDGDEGAFLPSSFWLAECYARQGRAHEAIAAYEQAMSAASPQGLFAEEVDPRTGELLGNYPQALTHLSHVSAALALSSLSADPAG